VPSGRDLLNISDGRNFWSEGVGCEYHDPGQDVENLQYYSIVMLNESPET